MSTELAWYEYVAAAGFIVLLLTLLYGWVERRNDSEPGWGYGACLLASFAALFPEAWAESNRFRLVAIAAVFGMASMLIPRRNRHRRATPEEHTP